jgi:large subunit ribosomal protein L25
MEAKTLQAVERTDLRKGPSGRLRRDGKIPAIIYGHREPRPVTIDQREFRSVFKSFSESTIVTIQVGEDSYDVLLKDYQDDILKDDIIHLDFFEVEAGKTLRTHIPVHITGTARGVREGGILEVLLRDLEVECLPRDIPEEFVVDVSGLDVGDTIHVADIPAPESVKILTHEDQTVVLVAHQRVEEEPEEEDVLEEGEAEGEDTVVEEEGSDTEE